MASTPYSTNTKMMHFTSFSCLCHKCNLKALFVLGQVVVNASASDQSANRHMANEDGTNGEHDNFDSVVNGL